MSASGTSTPPPAPTPSATGLDAVQSFLAYVLSLPTWQGFALAICATIIATTVVGMGSLTLARRVLSRIEGDVDDQLFAHLHAPTYLTVFFTGLHFSMTLLPLTPVEMEYVSSGAITVMVVLWGHASWRIGTTLTATDARGASTTKYLDEAFLPIFNNLWKVGTILVAGLTILKVWGIDITPLLASAGIAGIAIGFAAKDTIANFFGGIALYFDNTYQKGDFIILDSGQSGNVIDVGIRSTVLRTREGIRVTVPNSVLNNALVVNESAPRRHRRISIPVSVAYGEDIDEVREVLLDVAANEEMVREQPPTRVRFLNLGDSGLELELRCWIDRPGARVRATDSLNTAIYKRFTEEHIEIPFPQHDVHLRTSSSSVDKS